MEVEEGAHNVVVELTRVQNAQDEGTQATLPSVGHGVGSGHIQRPKHCNRQEQLNKPLFTSNNLHHLPYNFSP
jgi:hypothetical protein